MTSHPPSKHKIAGHRNSNRIIVPNYIRKSQIEYPQATSKVHRTLPTSNTSKTYRLIQTSIMPVGQQESGVTSGVKFVTSTVGNTVGGLTNTVGGVVGALGRGVGETVEGATGSAGRPVARGISDATTSVEDGANKIAGGVKRAGEGK
ncbi:hypothetical protein BU26DRAFT_513873 [Trematosphaeria pertusa]|uniref:Uncharacterized protein n=1 Tax=Trematosphaeria pertusa TaxID=390896 RepID=A0A6A6J2U6_9PLEO|nr:uncharacterized protein BU26DRAFT_513873 [Trematosphaeria pertusa]KAF2257174.1 hypothetical protein BU26DRAFT_513873 [Trematosphaeria pertusa]